MLLIARNKNAQKRYLTKILMAGCFAMELNPMVFQDTAQNDNVVRYGGVR